jgi:hypothetical protein
VHCPVPAARMPGMDEERKTSWTGWFMLALVLSFFHLAILFPLSAAVSDSHPWVSNIALVFVMGGGELAVLANSLIYGALATVAIFLWRRRSRPPA